MKALVLGLGNSILSDDGVGIYIAERLKSKVPHADVKATPLVGLGLLDLMAGYERLFVVDAFLSSQDPPGTVRELKDGDGALHLFTSHGMDFLEIMMLGRQLGYPLPETVHFYGIAIGDQVTFGETLSPALRQQATSILKRIVSHIDAEMSHGHPV